MVPEVKSTYISSCGFFGLESRGGSHPKHYGTAMFLEGKWKNERTNIHINMYVYIYIYQILLHIYIYMGIVSNYRFASLEDWAPFL